MTTLQLRVPGTEARNSTIFIGDEEGESFRSRLVESAGEGRVHWIWDQAVQRLWRERLEEADGCRVLREAGARSPLLTFAAGEENKRLATVEDLARRLVRRGADRGSLLVAVGGGVTGDLVGFLASIYMRGIPCAQVPTTLLSQVDSSIGGKTGVDLPEGKNLLGAFHQPQLVWIRPAFLQTLPPFQFRQGMAEVIKTALLGDPALWQLLEERGAAIRAGDREARRRMITACCRVKIAVVEADEREGGLRRTLNLGHTVGHALERLSGYRLGHGDAVALGMLAIATWSSRLGIAASRLPHRLRQMLEFWELPVKIPGAFAAEEIVSAFKVDKKRVADRLHFILPVEIGSVVDRCDLDPRDLVPVLRSLE